MNGKNIAKSGLLGIFLTSFLFGGEIENLSVAVDVAGKQRMFSQRMLKDYAMIGLQNNFGSPQKDLDETIASFSDSLEALIRFNTEAATEESLIKVKTLWEPIQAALKKPPAKETAGKMQEDIEVLLAQANDATVLFAKQTGEASGEIINISGRQRMLSQRMASLYMLKVWGIDDPKFKEKMDKAMNLFGTSLQTLMASEMNTPEINALLNNVKKSFMFFEIMNKSESKFIPALIFKKSNEILKDMNTVTGMYAKIASKK